MQVAILKTEDELAKWTADRKEHSPLFDPSIKVPVMVAFEDCVTGWDNPYVEYQAFGADELRQILSQLEGQQ